MDTSVFIGIDWGTHSSKWACLQQTRNRYLEHFPLYSSDIRAAGDLITFGSDVFGEDEGVRGLKGVLINDPLGSSFWDSQRLDTNTSLGEAVSFSLCCLLADAARRRRDELAGAQIGFSFPNWLIDAGKKAQAAAKNFREAAAVAIEVATRTAIHELPVVGEPYRISAWRELAELNRQEATARVGTFDIASIMQTSFSTSNGTVQWGFITESGAAGLPYLRAMEVEDVPGAHGLAKLLVVDVGAGSTDIGYMLRVQHRETKKEKLYYFGPAPSFGVAGNELTKELKSHYRAMNQPISDMEAEARKLQQTGWHSLSFAESWRKRIAQHVYEYVQGVPDERWLPLLVPLNVVVTGGSGLVPGLKDEIKKAAVSALESRKVEKKTLDKVIMPGEHIPRLRFRTEAEYARRAVCLGASDADRPGCTYIASMSAPSHAKFAVARKWV